MQKIIILIFLGTFVISCAPNTIVHKTYNRKLINSVNHFPSCGHISLIKEGDIKVYNDSLSKVSGKILDSIVRINESFPVVALHLDSIELILFNNQIIEMFNSILTKNTISTITIPQLLLDKMEGYDQRFYMATLIEGFSRSGANYAGQLVDGLVTGILTLGLISKTPYKKITRVMNVIIDKESKRIVYFSEAIPAEKSPFDVKFIKKQYQKIVPPAPSY